MKKYLWNQSDYYEKLLTKLKLSLYIITVINILSITAVFGQSENLTVKKTNASMLDIIKDVEKQSKITFVYSMDAINAIGKKTIDVKNVKIDSLMKVCLSGSEYDYILENNVVVIKKKTEEKKSQSVSKRIISGVVLDTKKEVIPGVTVAIKGTSLGCVTGIDGEFKIEIPDNVDALVFSFIGMKTKEIKLGVSNSFNVVLEEDISDLDEVTVVAYGERKKRELISSVSSMKGDEMKEIPTSSFENLLQGHMAGVEVSNISGSPGGGGTKVNIRGYNSLFISDINDGSPLYVVDGVPVHSFTSPVTGTNTLAEIDPATIESVEVLKDAASAALYGSRASNGVILITTKQGKVGKGKFSANFSHTYSILPATPTQTGGHMERMAFIYAARNQRMGYMENGEYVFPDSYIDSYNKGLSYDWFWNGGGKYQNVPRMLVDSLNAFYNNSSNWWKEAFRSGKILNANIQASGGSETARYLVGAGWYDEKGIMYASDFSRINFITNVNVTPRKNLHIDARMYLTYTDRSKNTKKGNFQKSSKYEGLTIDPKSTSSLLPRDGDVKNEIIKNLNDVTDKNYSYGIRASLDLRYEIIKNLNISTSIAVDFTESKRNTFFPSHLDYQNFSSSEGEVGSAINTSNENLISYKFSLNNKHNFDFLLGFSYLRQANDFMYGSGQGSPSDYIHYVPSTFADYVMQYGSVKVLKNYSSNFEEKILLSYFGRFAYNYNQKYLFEFTYRKDGSSVFGEDVRWANFPSIAMGWAFSEENFTKNLWWLSYGKIRASWGTSGQQFAQAYLAHGTLKSADGFMGNTGIEPSSLYNKNLTWEETDQYDIGLDIDLFDYRLKFKMDYYYKYSKSLLWNVTLPGDYFYHQKAWQNVMEISNEGLELELHYDILRNSAISWRGKFNISRNWNRFEKSYTNMDIEGYVIGRPIFSIYAFKDNGYIQSEKDYVEFYDQQGNKRYLNSGSPLYAFLDGARNVQDMNMDGSITDEDKIYAGSSLPVAYGGIVNEFKWKDFDLNILFTYSLGRKIINKYAMSSLIFRGNAQPIFLDYENVNFWEKEGDNTDYPAMRYLNTVYKSQFDGEVTSNIERVNFLRLKQLTVGYYLPQKWMNKAGIESLRLFFTAENLFLLSNYSGLDPEIVNPYEGGYDNFSSYPLARKLTLGVTLNF